MPLDAAGVLWTELSVPSSSGPVGVCSVVCLAPLHLHQLSLLGLSSALLLHLHSAPSVALVPFFASPSGGCVSFLLLVEHTYQCALTPVARYESLPWHDRAGGLPTNPLVPVGPVERLALQLSLHFEQSGLVAGVVRVHAA